MNEEWRSIDGYEGYYEVSNLGRVRSVDRLVRHCSGGKRTQKGRLLIPTFDNRNGIAIYNLYRDSICQHVRAHILVATTFRRYHD